jgi:hypothetical protein
LLPAPELPRPRVLRELVPALLRAAGLRVVAFRAVVALPAAEPAFARDDVDLAAAELFARVDVDLARDAVALRAPVERLAEVLRAPADLPAPVARADPPELELALAVSSPPHLPDITRCAASATASAMSDPSLAALEATLLAAC